MGASGALVHISDDHVVKYAHPRSPAADRVDVQARWLRGAPHEFLPHVGWTAPGAYRMERLTELPDFVDDGVLVRVLVSRLEQLWAQPSLHVFDPTAHLAYVRRRAEGVGLAEQMERWGEDAVRTVASMDPCVIHGDPTIDNCMLRHGGELVVTDPIPPGAHLPSVRAHDIGKVLQSAMGYEQVACGRRPTTVPWVDSTYWVKLFPDVDDEEWNLCLYMAAVHFLRLLPYTPQHTLQWVSRVHQLIE